MDLYFERHDGEAATIEQFVKCFADASGARPCRSSCAGTRRPARRRCSRHGTYDAAAKTYTLDLTQAMPPTPGQPVKEPMVIPLTLGLVGRRRRRSAARRSAASRSQRDVIALDQAGADLRLHRRRRAPGAVAQPRLLGAGEAHRQPHGRRPDAGSPRTTAIRSTAGRRCRRWRRACWSAMSRCSAPAARRRTTRA